MKPLILISTYALLLFYACNPAEDKVPYNGHLVGEIKYTGASNMAVDNVIIILTGAADNEEAISKRITNDGKYDLELPAGTYTMDLEGNRCASDDLPYTVTIIADETRTKDINIEQLPYSLVISRNGEELQDGSTVSLGSADVLNVWNRYSSNTLEWKISAYPQPSWIIFEQSTGTISGGGSRPIVYSIDTEKMPEYGTNSSDLILTAIDDNEGRGYKITVQAERKGGEPGKAIIVGNNMNICPDKSVMLTAEVPEATSYRWYMGGTLQNGATGNTFEAKYNGTYYVVGLNSRGEGIKSDGHSVSINYCPDPPARAIIQGNATNDCSKDGQQVMLTASATGATNYVWRNGSELLPETGNKLVVNDVGTHTIYAIGVNSSGEGQESAGKIITISSCVPSAPSGVSANVDITGNRLKLSWNYANSANRYRVQRCNNVAMTGCEGEGYFRETDSFPEIHIEESALFCGMNYFRVTSVNEHGESAGTTVSYNHATTVKAPIFITVNQYGSLDWPYSRITGVHTRPTIFYDIYRKIGNGEWEFIDMTTSEYYHDDEYSFGGSMYYRIRAYITTRCGTSEDFSGVW